MSSGSHETGSTAKKVTASDSAKPGPHIHTYFLSQGSRVRVEMGTKSEKVTASDSAKPGPHIHIFFFNSGVTGTRRNGDKE